jgi:hypothetical protein
MRTTFVVGAALAVTIAAGGATTDVYAEGTETVDCMTYDEVLHHDARSLDMRVVNACPKALVCTVTWTVRCAKTTTEHSASELLAAGAGHVWTATAATCSDEWSIDSRWRCDEPAHR